MRRRVTRRLTGLQTMYIVLKHSKTWCYNDIKQLTVTGTQPGHNRKVRQFNNAQYCTDQMVTQAAVSSYERVCMAAPERANIGAVCSFWFLQTFSTSET